MIVALTLIEPWGTAILTHGKTVENRPWAPAKKHLGTRIAVHAGKKRDKEDAWGLIAQLGKMDGLLHSPLGCLRGTVELVGYHKAGTIYVADDNDGDAVAYCAQTVRDSEWRVPGAIWWVLRDPRVLPEPIPCAGALGLWKVPSQYVAALEAL